VYPPASAQGLAGTSPQSLLIRPSGTLKQNQSRSILIERLLRPWHRCGDARVLMEQVKKIIFRRRFFLRSKQMSVSFERELVPDARL
jgi:hypothetical protein